MRRKVITDAWSPDHFKEKQSLGFFFQSSDSFFVFEIQWGNGCFHFEMVRRKTNMGHLTNSLKPRCYLEFFHYLKMFLLRGVFMVCWQEWEESCKTPFFMFYWRGQTLLPQTIPETFSSCIILSSLCTSILELTPFHFSSWRDVAYFLLPVNMPPMLKICLLETMFCWS